MKQSFLSLLLVLLGMSAFAQPAAPTVTGATTICSGTNTTLMASGASGAVFKWYDAPTGGTLLTNAVSYTIPNRNTAGTYHYYVEQSVNSVPSARTDVAIVVNQTPTVTLNSGNTTICNGSSITLTASGATSYSWNNGPATGTQTVSPTATTVYTVTGTDQNCPSAPVSVTIAVYKTVVSPVASIDVCYGTNTVLSASGASTYLWSPGGATTAAIMVSPTTSTTYTVTGSAPGCAPTTDTIRLNVRPNIGLFAGANQTVAEGTIATLTAGSATATSYVWNPNQGSNQSLNGTTVSVLPTTTTTYTVTGTDVYNCTATAQTVVTVSEQIRVAGVTTVCAGGTTTLTASGTGPFAWYDAASGGTTLATTASFTTPVMVTGADYWVAGNNGIRKKVSVSLPTFSNTPYAFPATVCAGDTVWLKGRVPGPINWYDAPTGGQLVSGTITGSGFMITPPVTKTYWAEIASAQVSVDFLPIDAMQTWTVPEGVTSVQVTAYGSKGLPASSQPAKGYSGKGGTVTATLNVVPGQVLNLFVGGTNCWNGGGNSLAGNRGGDATDIRMGGTGLLNRVLVAGGGGGSGWNQSYNNANSNTGAGGGLIGQDGGTISGFYEAPYWLGRGGSQTAGGQEGYQISATFHRAGSGSFGQGGGSQNAYTGTVYSNTYYGGGGGGGFFGGGGGVNHGDGGGGSSYTNPVYCSNVTMAQGTWDNAGALTLTYSVACGALTARVPVTVTVSPLPIVAISSPNVCLGTALTAAPSANATQLQWMGAGGLLNTVYPSWNTTATTVAGTTTGSGLNQLSAPQAAFVGPNGDLYIPDGGNHRIMKWSAGATTGIVVAGGNGAGAGANQLNTPAAVYVDESGTLYIADKGNQRIQKWTASAVSGTTLFGTTGNGGIATNQLYDPVGITRDDTGRFYITEAAAHRVSRWVVGAPTGTRVAGTTGSSGSGLTQLTNPAGAVVDKSGAVYVADLGNNRVVKWASGATTGMLVAGGNGSGSAANQISPAGIARDGNGIIYVADGSQARIQRWVPGDVAGTTVTPVTGSPLTSANGIGFDVFGTMYVTDGSAGQVRKFSTAPLSPLTYIPTASGVKRALVTNAFGCAATSNTITLSNIPTATISAPDSVCVGGAARVLTLTGGNAVAPYTLSYSVNGGAVQTVVTPPAQGVRYVRIKQNKSNANLNLAEIQAIDATTGINVALAKPATASSTLNGYPLANINDGNLNNFWHNTSGSTTEYVEIDLGAPGYVLSSIKVTNRGDCCQDRSSNLQLSLKDATGTVLESREIDAYQGQNNGLTSTHLVSSFFSSVYQDTIATALPSDSKYKLVSISSGGCTSTAGDSTRIKVSAYANIVTEPVPTLSVCAGNTMALTTSTINATKYQWQLNGTTLTGRTDTVFTKTAALTDAGSYRLIATNTAGCSDTSINSVVTVNETPDATLSGNASYCKDVAGAAITLNNPGINLDNTVQYTLNSGTPVSVVFPVKQIRYIRVQGPTSFNQRLGVTEIKAFVPGNPMSVSLGKPAVSSGVTSGYANANVTDGDLTTSWLNWQYGSTGFVEVDLQNSYPVSQVDLYAGTASGGGFGVNNFQLVCMDSLRTVVSDQTAYIYPTAPSSPALKNWSVQVTRSATLPVNTSAAGTATYQLIMISSSNGCARPKSDSIRLSVFNRPFITQQPPAVASICESSSLTLAGTSPTALGYKWMRNGSIISDTTSMLSRASVVTSDSGTYKLIAVGVAGCNDTSIATAVTVKSIPTATLAGEVQLCQGAVAPEVTLKGFRDATPYTFMYAINGGTPQSAVTPTDQRVRYVRIKQNIPVSSTLIAEMRAIDMATGQNVALNKPVTATSGSPYAITDGSTSTFNYWSPSVLDSTQYAEIDLGGRGYYLSDVQIVSSSFCCQNTLRNLQLIFRDSAGVPIASRQVDAYRGINTMATTSFLNETNKVALPVSSAVAGLYSYRLLSVSSTGGCSRSYADSVQVAIAPKATITTQPLNIQNVCTPNPLVLSVNATGAVFYRWQRNNVNIFGAYDKEYLKTGATSTTAGTYRVIAMTPDGCNDTSVNVTVTVGSVSGTSIAMTAAADTQVHTNGLDYVYTNASCEPIAEVADAAGGNTLGRVNVQMQMDSTVQLFGAGPYLQRHYDITPENNGPAIIKLYATQAEFDAYNARIVDSGLVWPKLPTGPTDTAGIGRLSILQFHGLPTAGTNGPGGQYNAAQRQLLTSNVIATTWNGNYWTMSFPVSGFSGFFITSGTGGTSLPVSLLGVAANNLGSENEVLWSTASEELGNSFEVERSFDGTAFTKIGTVGSSGQASSEYRLVDHSPATGINYYRIRAVSMNGAARYSKVVSARVKEGAFVVEAFPNPTQGDVTVRLSAAPGPDALVTISDVSGKRLREVPVKGSVVTVSMEDLAAGFYLLQYRDGVRTQIIKITKQ
ncbi:MAG: T9SS type A sorting domain-containing protein [Sphingobacteriales bacterium]|nr:MAG: T9SS type A sorting domain-containing protein [Sphingobacteriales bacterium]